MKLVAPENGTTVTRIRRIHAETDQRSDVAEMGGICRPGIHRRPGGQSDRNGNHRKAGPVKMLVSGLPPSAGATPTRSNGPYHLCLLCGKGEGYGRRIAAGLAGEGRIGIDLVAGGERHGRKELELPGRYIGINIPLQIGADIGRTISDKHAHLVVGLPSQVPVAEH